MERIRKATGWLFFKRQSIQMSEKAMGLLVWVCELTPWKYFYTLRVEKVNDYNDLINELWSQVYNTYVMLPCSYILPLSGRQ